MKGHLTIDDPAGWYECRFLRNPPGTRVARYWSGKYLHDTPGTPVDGGVSNLIIDDREYTEFVALVAVPQSIPNEFDGKNAWEIAVAWYGEQEIANSIQRHRKCLSERHERIPEDVYSPEFAKWLTDQYRLAMAKGIQIGRRQA